VIQVNGGCFEFSLRFWTFISEFGILDLWNLCKIVQNYNMCSATSVCGKNGL